MSIFFFFFFLEKKLLPTLSQSIYQGDRIVPLSRSTELGASLEYELSYKNWSFVEVITTWSQQKRKLTSYSFRMIFHATDITDFDQQLAAFRAAQSFSPSGQLSHVFANAGNIGSYTLYPVENIDSSATNGGEATKTLVKPSLPCVQVSLIGMYYTAYLALHFLTLGTKAKSGALDTGTPAEKDLLDRSLTLMGSVMSYKGYKGLSDYCMAKAGVRGMFKSLRNDIKESTGIRLNLLAPTYVETPIYPKGIDLSVYKFAPMEFLVRIAQQLVCDTTIHGMQTISF